MKRDSLDASVSDLVREMSNWTCDKCGIVDDEGQARGKSRGMHCSHFFGRGIQATRWELMNLSCLCAACHKEMGDRPDEHKAWFALKIGLDNFDDLRFKSKQVSKWPKHKKVEARKHYSKEYKRIRALRADGHQGYIQGIDFE